MTEAMARGEPFPLEEFPDEMWPAANFYRAYCILRDAMEAAKEKPPVRKTQVAVNSDVQR